MGVIRHEFRNDGGYWCGRKRFIAKDKDGDNQTNRTFLKNIQDFAESLYYRFVGYTTSPIFGPREKQFVRSLCHRLVSSYGVSFWAEWNLFYRQKVGQVIQAEDERTGFKDSKRFIWFEERFPTIQDQKRTTIIQAEMMLGADAVREILLECAEVDAGIRRAWVCPSYEMVSNEQLKQEIDKHYPPS